MKISVIGGGPGGAFAAFLLKKAHPDWDVIVYERSPPAVTYGWGIVLPEKLYETLRTADEPVCEQIEELNTHWDPIDTIHRAEQIRCGGHPYTSILRSDLLEIVQTRCQELDVDIRFETEVDDVEAIAADSDLMIGADGIHSRTREQYADELGTMLSDGKNLFSWFGTNQQFDALTHIYEENEHGLWHGAAYPGPTSTFVITCEPKTWESAGIGEMTHEEYKRYFEDAFADHLGGHSLKSSNDRWRPFTTVSNETWYHDNVVLLGDAAHTAHFTIGSGTRMAIEDAIGLAAAVNEHERDIDSALEQYEADRKPHVDTLQGAADRSQSHFEHLERYARLDPIPFAALYLTRTGHNTYESLREEDPSFIDEINRWFAKKAGVAIADDDDPGPPSSQPFSLGDVTVSNRLVGVAEVGSSSAGSESDDGSEPLLVDTDAGMMTVPLSVEPDGDGPALATDADTDHWKSRLDAFAGRHDDTAVTARLVHNAPDDSNRVEKTFATAAERADAAGFDTVEIDLVGSGLLETGSDATGTSAPSVVGAIRDVLPAERALSATVTLTGETEEEYEPTYEAALKLVDNGCDALTVLPPEGEDSPDFAGREHSKRVRNEVGVTTIAGGPQPSADAVNTALSTGRADLCLIDPKMYDDGE